MRPSDRAEFVRVLNGLAAIKSKDLTAEALDLWWSAMARWEIGDFKAAASHLVTACQFMPTPYDFSQMQKASQPIAAEAWANVLSGAPLDPRSRTARAAKLMGGQQHIRMANIERDLPHIQRRFLEAYEELSDVEETREALEDFGMRRLPKAVQTNTDLDEALRPMLLEDEGSEASGRGGFAPIV